MPPAPGLIFDSAALVNDEATEPVSHQPEQVEEQGVSRSAVEEFIIFESAHNQCRANPVKDEEASEGAISTAVAMEDEKGCAEAIMKVNEALAMQLQRELSGLRPR